MQPSWLGDYAARLHANLEGTTVTKGGVAIDLEELLDLLVRGCERLVATKRKLIFMGNGGSAAVSSHMAQDFSKIGGVRAVAFNDASLLTCLANDYSYAEVFEKALGFYADSGDLAVVISSSGKSPNVLAAAKQARALGCGVLTITGFEAGNPLSQLGDINVHVPASTYGLVEVSHHAVIHAWLDRWVATRTQ